MVGIVLSGEKNSGIVFLVRKKEIEKLKTEKFDLLVIGGGATGTGVAVDAAYRGLKVALVERRDFSSETSSRSTKLVHGGVRYLENAVKQLDPEQLDLVRDALKERGNFLKNAPHLAHSLAIVTPVYSWWEALYIFLGLRVYDFLARNNSMPSTRFKFKTTFLKEFPMLDEKGLKGGLLYYDGQFDDARMNLCLAKTAQELGAVTVNYTQVESLLKKNGSVVGARMKDVLSGETWETFAKVTVNATGPFSDQLRVLDSPKSLPMLKASSGSHIILDGRYVPRTQGILIPKTKDGRVVFILPWHGKTLVGTTDNAAAIVENPKPTEEDIHFILETVAPLYRKPPTRSDILSSWTGLRPLVFDPEQKGTAALSRDHVIEVSQAGLLSIAGGKWTTYRKMAEELVDKAIEVGTLRPQWEIGTEELKVAGAQKYGPELVEELKEKNIPEASAEHLAGAYGDRAFEVLAYAEKGNIRLLHPNHPYLEAEVLYGVKAEFACTIVDILARRTRLSFLDQEAALESISKVASLMAPVLGWSGETTQQQIRSAIDYFKPALSKN